MEGREDAGSTAVQVNERTALLDSTSDAGNVEQERAGGATPRGLGVVETSFFILTGVLFTIPLPYALKQTGFYSGIMLMIVLPFIMIYMAILLGRCWIMLLEMWPERYTGHRVRRPFPAIGREAGGRPWELIVWVSVNVANFGVTVVDLLVAAEGLELLVPHHISFRVWLLLCTAIMLPFVWLGSPMDSWMVGWGGGLLGLFASVSLLVSVIVAGVTSVAPATTMAPITTDINVTMPTTSPMVPVTFSMPQTLDVTFSSFWLGTSTQIFTYAGMSIFPSLQHDMRKPRNWPYAVLLSYSFIAVFAMATATTGLQFFGPLTNPNVLLNIDCRSASSAHILAKLCSVLYIIVSLCNGVVGVLPITQDAEEILKLPASKSLQKYQYTIFLHKLVPPSS